MLANFRRAVAVKNTKQWHCTEKNYKKGGTIVFPLRLQGGEKLFFVRDLNLSPGLEIELTSKPKSGGTKF